MRLEEEITIYQFGQGALSEAVMLDTFTQLDVSRQRKRFIRLYHYVSGLKLTASDVDQAITDCSLAEKDPIRTFLNLSYLKVGSRGIIYKPCMEEPPGGDLSKPYTVLLYVFKAAYQRRYAAEKDTSTKWWFRDFSDSKTAQDILTAYYRLTEEVYANASFRSEFTAMAKLWHIHYVYTQTLADMPPTELQTNFRFISYEQIENGAAWIAANDTIWACAVVRRSVEKALSRQYKLDMDEARQVTLSIIDRHLQETYLHGLYDD